MGRSFSETGTVRGRIFLTPPGKEATNLGDFDLTYVPRVGEDVSVNVPPPGGAGGIVTQEGTVQRVVHLIGTSGRQPNDPVLQLHIKPAPSRKGGAVDI